LNERRRILLVEDDPDNNRIFTIALSDNGFKVDTFESPQLALSEFKPNYYDLIILDFRMPHMRGDELYQKLRKIDSKFKVCVMSAFGSEEYKARFSSTTSANRIYYMSKPISVDELVAKVKEVI